MTVATTRRRAAALLLALVAACGSRPAPTAAPPAPHLAPGGHHHPTASFTNGDFETGDLRGWAQATYLNNGLTVAPPTLRSQLALAAGGTNFTKVVNGTVETVIPAGLTAGASLRVPKYGTNVVVVNENGLNKNVNGIKQSMTVTNFDVDPSDGKAHVRFALAPVLQNPNHGPTEQPYFWATLTNITRNAVLFSTFNYSNQAGVPWKSDPVNTTTLYTDWQAFDITPGAAQLAVGDVVELEVIAAGCSLGGHYGHIYVDGIGPYLPGLAVAASAPAQVNQNSQFTYQVAYSNHGTGAAANTTFTMVLPAGTSFGSVNAPGATCTTPAAGNTGTVSCNLGTLNPASSGNLAVTVNVTVGQGNTIANGNYAISASGVSPLLGPLVTTTVTKNAVYADLQTSASDGVAAVGWGATTVYTVGVRNGGPTAVNGATVNVPVPTNVSAFTGWTCSAAGGATCGAAGGTGPLSTTANLPVGGAVTYRITAAIAPASGASTIALQATAATPGGVTENVPGDNVAVDRDDVGTLRTLTVTKTGAGSGTVRSSPIALDCGSGCGSQSAAFLDGTVVVLTASSAAGQRFTGWTAGPCAGNTSPTCSVPLTADTTVAADFLAGDWTVTGSAPSGGGTVTCTSPVLDAQPSTCTVAPSARHRLTRLVDGAADVTGSVSGGSYVLPGVTSDRVVVGTFAANTVAAALGASPASASHGAAVTFTATLTAGAPVGTPSGTVTFSAGGAPICAGVALAGGVATCTTSALAAGTASVTADYTGDSTYPPASAAPLAYTVSPASSSVAIVSSANPAAHGAALTFTATVSGAGAAPSGEVTFRDGASVLCGGPVALVGGAAQCSPPNLVAGSHALTASYPGDANHAASSGALTQTVTPAATVVVLGTAPAPSVFGQDVVFTVSVVGAGLTPGGTVTLRDGAAVLCGGPLTLSGGSALCHTASLSAASHALTAAYSGDDDHAASSSAVSTHTVNRAATVATLSASPAATVHGQPILLTATVGVAAPGAGAPTGQVEFYDGATPLGSAPVDPLTGEARYTVPGSAALAVGPHDFSAAYSGDASFTGALSPGVAPHVVAKADALVTVTPSRAPSVAGEPVTFSIAVGPVAPGSGTPMGDVSVSLDGGPAQTLTLSAGRASTALALAVGNHTVAVSYGGDGSFLPATGSVGQTVGRAATTTMLASSASPAAHGVPVTLTVTVAAVAPGAGVPSGTVALTDGATPLATLTLDAAGSATFDMSSLPVGSHALAAAYAGDASFTASSDTATQVVTQAAPTLALASSAPSAAHGSAVTLTATVSGAGLTPGGTVTFSEGATVLCGAVALVGGTATCSPANLRAGSHTVTAAYSGDGNYAAAGSSAAQTITPATPTVTVAAAPSPSVTGQPVTLTVGVSGAGLTPTGTVTLTDGGVVLCGGPLALTGGSATCPVAPGTAGPHALVATYSGDTNYAGGAPGTAALTVTRAVTDVALSVSPASTVFGEPIVLTAAVSVTGPGAGTPTGQVDFHDGAALVGTAIVDPVTGLATFTIPGTSPLAVGPHHFSATYGGDAALQGGASPVAPPHTVGKSDALVTITPMPAASVAGEPVAFAIAVTAVGPGSGTPTGDVTVSLDGGPAQTLTLTAGAASATLALGVGGHTVAVAYAGDLSFSSAASSATQTVTAAATTTALVASAGSTTYGEAVTFTATVSPVAPGAGLPTGSVTFSEGGAILATVALDGTGRAAFTTSDLSAGSHALTATSGGDAAFTGSAGLLTHAVTPATTSLLLTSSSSPIAYGATLTLSAAVTGPGALAGTVTFTDGATVLCGPVALTAGTATCAVATLDVGAHTLGASYSGDADHAGSTTTLAQTVQDGSTTVALTSSSPSASHGSPVTFTATVSGAGATPGGTVTFSDGATVLCGPVALVGGIATCTPSNLPAGSHTVTVAYSGDANYGAGSGSVAQTITPAPAAAVVVAAPSPAVTGQAVTLTVAVSGPGLTPTGTVTLTDGGVLLCGGPLTLTAGSAVCPVAPGTVGPHALVATYSGDANHAGGAPGTATLTVARALTDVALSVSPATTVYGEPIVLTATVTVTAPGTGTPTGQVDFYDGADLVGTATVDPLSGVATFTLPPTSPLAVGPHHFSATYGGDTALQGGDSPVSLPHAVAKSDALVTVTPSPASSVAGESVTFAIALTAVAPGSGTPGGDVTVSLDGGPAQTLALSAGSATAALRLGVGSHTLDVAYGGDLSFRSATGSATHTVTAAAAATALVASASPTAYGTAVTFTATVSPVAPGAGAPSGSVTFTEGGAPLATVGLDATGRATFTTSTLPAGPHALSATYAGDASFTGSAAALSHTVTPAPSSLVLASSSNPIVYGSTLTLTATVAGPGTPAGTVAFRDGASVLCPAVPLAGGVATCTVATLDVGGHTLGASYSGDADHALSTATLGQTVDGGPSTLALTSSQNPSVQGGTVTFTLTVTGAGATPTGPVTFRADGSSLCADVPLTGGAASCSTAALPGGARVITASYAGDARHGAGDSTLAQLVAQAAPTVALASSSPSAAHGSPVTFTATVSGTGATPDGTVTFSDGATVLCGPVALVGGTATCSPANLPAGSHTVTAAYSGDGNYAASSGSAAQTVTPATPAVVVVASPSPSVTGQDVTLSVAVSGPGLTPTGTVTLTHGGVVLCGGPLTLAGGAATCHVAPGDAGPHALVATYSGDANHAGGAPGTATLPVDRALTDVALAVSAPATVHGEPIVLTATVSVVAPGAGTPSGEVEFRDGTTVLGKAPVDPATGQATFTIPPASPLAVGSHDFSAVYLGDAALQGGLSPAAPAHVVTPSDALVTVTPSAAPSVAGESVTFTVAVTPAAPGGGVPTGDLVVTVDGGAPMTVPLASGAAATTIALPVGRHLVTVAYAGDASFHPATTSVPQDVARAATSTALVASAGSTPYGSTVTFTATVAPVAPGAGVPTGSVAFTEGGAPLATVAVDGTGRAAFTTSSLAAGAHALAASYAGDASYTASAAAPLAHAVTTAPAAVAVVASPSPSVSGEDVTLTVSVTGPGAPPTGTVTLTDGGTVLCGGPLTLVNGVATCHVAPATPGDHPVVVTYSGDANHAGGAPATVTQTVAPAGATVTLAAPPAGTVYGQPVVLTATVTVVAPGTGQPGGTVTFFDGPTPLGTAAIDPATGRATFVVPPSAGLTPGPHSFTAGYGGDATHAGATSPALPVPHAVARSASALSVTAPAASSRSGEAVTFTIAVSAVAPGSGTPTGEVVVTVDGSAPVAVPLASGQASFTTAAMTAGPHTVAAAYAGDAGFLAASGSLGHDVVAGGTTVTVTSSRQPSRRGRPITFTATVSAAAPASGTPEGSVTFKDGATVLATVPLHGGVASFTTRALRKGTHPIGAGYEGGGAFEAAAGALAGGQVVENTPPVAGAGAAFAVGVDGARGASIPLGGALDAGDFTLEAWVRPARLPTSGAPPQVFILGDVPVRLALGIGPDGSLALTAGAAIVPVPATLHEGTWHHLAVVAAGGEVRVYVDGALAGTASATLSGTGSTLRLGSGLAGELDEVRAWTVARSAGDLREAARRPLLGDEPGLAGLWRMDEGAGLELFDASPAGRDGAIELTSPANTAFVPSTAWRAHRTDADHALAAIAAGYDADGDALALSLVAPAAHGTAEADAAALQLRYQPDAGWSGDDAFSWRLDDGESAAEYAAAVGVTAPLFCSATAQCAPGDLCIAGACVPRDRLKGESGPVGCGSGPASGVALSALLGWLLLRRRRRAPAALLVVLAALGRAAPAAAQTPEGFALQTFEPTAAGDGFLVVPGTSAAGHLEMRGALTGSWATEPLLLVRDEVPVPGGRTVHRQFWSWAGASVGLYDRFLVDLAVPVALWQSGSKPFPTLAQVSAAGLGDIRLGARWSLPLTLPGAAQLALGAQAWLPTGSREAFTSDGSARVEPRLSASGEVGRVAWGASAGFLARARRDLGYTAIGPALTYTAGAAFRLGPWRVGPELYGRRQLAGETTSPVEGLLAGRWQLGDWNVGGAVGGGFDRAPGAAPFRVLAQLTWRPDLERRAAERLAAEREAERLAAEARERAAREAAEREAERARRARLAAEEEAARRAEAERLALEKAAAERRAAERLASEKTAHVRLTPQKIEILQAIQFELNRDVIRPVSEAVLGDVAAVLRSHPELAKVRVEGHTDATGKAKLNTALSARRAEAVVRWLVERGGVEGARLDPRGYGPERPVADNKTPKGRARNRRVEFRIVGE